MATPVDPSSTERGAGGETPLQLLQQLGYVVTRRIADSDRGQVVAASDRAGQAVAIRILPPGRLSGEAATAFQKEARAGLRLKHPHIVRSIATGERAGMRYLVMELIDGQSLAERVRSGGALSEREAVVLLAQLSQALGYAARQSVAQHRLAPSDVLLAPPRLGVHEPFCAKLGNCGLTQLAHLARLAHKAPAVPDPIGAALEDADRIALASTICWSLTPPRTGAPSRRPPASTSTMRLPGVSPEAMQLIGRMLTAPALPWAEIVERSRHLASLPAASPGG